MSRAVPGPQARVSALRRFFLAVLCACLLPTPTHAESPADVLREFGLVGTWSPDCSKNPNIEPGARVTYELSATGEAQYRSVVRFSISEAVESIVQIEQATILDERKIKTVIRPLKITTAAGAETRPFYFRKQEIVTEKIGSKNHVLSNHFVDESAYVIIDNGKMRNGQQMPLLEKCTD